MCMLHLYNKNKCLKHFKYTTPCKIKTTQVFYLYFSNTEKGTHRPQKYFFEFSIFSVFGNTVTFHSPHVFDKTHTFPPPQIFSVWALCQTLLQVVGDINP